MQTTNLVWLASTLLAVALLLAMMRRRQNQLSGLLRDYVQEQIAWARKKSRASRMARKAAATQAASETTSTPARNALPEFDAAAVEAASHALADLVDQSNSR